MKYYHIVLGIFLVSIIISSISYNNIYAQDQSKESIQWKTYTDPQSKFSIDYPSDWLVEPKQNRFDPVDVKFIKKETVTLNDENSVEQNAAMFGITYGTNLDMSNIDLKAFVEELSKRNQFTYNNYREIEGDIDKYKMDTNPCAGFIAAHTNGLQEQGQLQLICFPDGKLFSVLYMTDQKYFDKYLPIAEKMIDSINILE